MITNKGEREMSVITRMNDEFNCSSIYYGGSTTPDMVDQVIDGPGVSAPTRSFQT